MRILYFVFSIILILGDALAAGFSRTYRPLSGTQRQRSETGASLSTGGRTRLTPLNTKRRRKQKSLFPELEGKETPPEEAPKSETVKRFVFQGEPTGWGYIKEEGPYYSMKGKNLGPLPAGTLFRYTAKKETKLVTMLVSEIRKKDGAWEGPYLLDCRRIAGYSGDVERIDPQIVENLGKYFTLCGQVERRREALEDAQHEKNPYFQTARKSYEQYMETVRQGAALEEQMVNATGSRRYQVQKKLAMLKNQQSRIKMKSDRDQAAYKKWKQAHPMDPNAFAADEKLSALMKERDAAAEPVRNLIPAE